MVGHEDVVCHEETVMLPFLLKWRRLPNRGNRSGGVQFAGIRNLEGDLISRRRFIEQTGLMAVSSLVANSALASVAGAFEDAALDPKLLERAKGLLRKEPFIDTHNDL